jgi:hypothetical protein
MDALWNTLLGEMAKGWMGLIGGIVGVTILMAAICALLKIRSPY